VSAYAVMFPFGDWCCWPYLLFLRGAGGTPEMTGSIAVGIAGAQGRGPMAARSWNNAIDRSPVMAQTLTASLDAPAASRAASQGSLARIVLRAIALGANPDSLSAT